MIRSRKNSIAFAALLALGSSFTATTAFAAPGDCLQWDVSGTWHIAQSNGTNVLMKIQQTGSNIQGVAEYSSYNNDAGKVDTVGGPVNGVYEAGGILRVTVYWSNSTAGLYVGQLQPDGGMSGYAHEQNDPENKASFRASGYPMCISREPVPPPPPPPLALGRVKEPPKALGRVETVAPRDPNMTMCDYARSAKARNSPAAPGLERQCLAGGGSMTPPPPPPPPPPAPVAAPDLDALAAVGADIAAQDPAVAEARSAEASAFYQLGFDIATGLFGDPALGAAGNTIMGPGSEKIRATLSAAGQRGFDASVKFHQARKYL